MTQSAEDLQLLCTGCPNPVAERLDGVWCLADKSENVSGNHYFTFEKSVSYLPYISQDF